MCVPSVRTLLTAFWLATGLLTTTAPAAAQMPSDPTGQSIEALVQKADALIQAGQYDAALRTAQEAVTACEASAGGGAEGVPPALAARAYNALGVAQAFKQMPEAEATLRRALSLREQHFGAEHPEVAQSLANLAMFYRLRGNYQAAEPLYWRALEVIEKFRGPEHPELATVLNNVALFYKTRGDYAAAEHCTGARWRFGKRHLAPSIPMWLQRSTIWRNSIAPRATTRPPSHCTSAPAPSGKKPWAGNIPTWPRC